MTYSSLCFIVIIPGAGGGARKSLPEASESGQEDEEFELSEKEELSAPVVVRFDESRELNCLYLATSLYLVACCR